jgi:hypothetical protein
MTWSLMVVNSVVAMAIMVMFFIEAALMTTGIDIIQIPSANYDH